MAEPTQGELLHCAVFMRMRTYLLDVPELNSVSVKTVNQIAKEAAGTAKRLLEKEDQR